MIGRLLARFRRTPREQDDLAEQDRLRRQADLARRAAEAQSAQQQARIEAMRDVNRWEG